MSNSGLFLDQVEKKFDDFQLGPISLALRRGRAYGLLGPNGAGKTTLLNLMALQLRLSAGRLSFDEQDVRWGDHAWKARFSYIREVPAFYDELSVGATLAVARGLYDRWDDRLAIELLERFGLRRDVVVGRLSKGNKVKVGIVVALAHRAELLLLDEPTAGLDPTARLELQRILRSLVVDTAGLVLVLSSHIFEDIEEVADEIVIVRHGQLVFQSDLKALLAQPLFRLPANTILAASESQLCWRKGGFVWVVPTADASVRIQALPGCESIPPGATVTAAYHGTEQPCAFDKR